MRSVYGAMLATIVSCSGASMAEEPVIGGPCEGCELVFSGQPEELSSTSRIAPVTVPGQPLVIEGTVRNRAGMPAQGIIVYAYHTNSEGIYPRAATRHGALRGWTRTDKDGNYRFDTIRPGAYPGQSAPQHVHMHVIEPGKGTYYIDDIMFSDDPLLTPEQQRQVRRGRGGDGLCKPTRSDDGVWHVKRDILLGSNIPGYDAAKPK